MAAYEAAILELESQATSFGSGHQDSCYGGMQACFKSLRATTYLQARVMEKSSL